MLFTSVSVSSAQQTDNNKANNNNNQINIYKKHLKQNKTFETEQNLWNKAKQTKQREAEEQKSTVS